MKLNILARGLALTIVIFPGVVFALGLGEIDVNSALNQPLRAEIKLLSVLHNEIEDLRVTLAPTEAFKRVGIDRPFVLSQLKFKPIITNSGQTVIQITTTNPIREPFLNFLVEVQWPRGQLLREYTILLDPPVLAEEQHSVGVQPPIAGANPKKSISNYQDRAARQNTAAGKGGEPAIDRQVPQPSFPVQGHGRLEQSAVVSPSQESQTYKTKRGDTLSGIAQDLRPQKEIGLSEMMIALLRANPQAFLRDNINEVMAGVILRMPTSAELASIDRAQAITEVAKHNALWREYRSKVASNAPVQLTNQTGKGIIPQNPVDGSGKSSGGIEQGSDPQEGNLEILAVDSNAGSQETNSTDNEINSAANDLALAQELAESRLRENEQLKSKVQDLEDMLEQQEQLINLQSDQLSDLQQRLSGEGTSPVNKAAVDSERIKAKGVTPIETEAVKVAEGVVQADVKLASDGAVELLETEGQLLSDQTELTEPEQTGSTVVEELTTTAEDVLASPISAQPDTAVEIEAKEQSASSMLLIGDVVDDLMAKPTTLAAIAGTGLLLMLFLLWKVVPRGRKDTDGPADQSAALSEEIPEESMMAAVRDSTQVSREDDEAPVEDPSHADEPEHVELAGEAISKQGAQAPDTVAQTGQSTGSDEKDETLTEAEVYIAYGLHQQAEELLKDAIKKRPERDDYRLKLLEAYYGDQNGQAFDTLAKEIHDRQGTDADSWERVLTMGRELSPNNPLYGLGMVDESVASANDSYDEFEHHEDPTLIAERPQDLNFDETEIMELPGEASVHDSGSGYTSDIVQELDADVATDQDVPLDEQATMGVEHEQGDRSVDSSVLDQDESVLEFDISDLQLSSEEETGENDPQSQETGLSYDSAINFEASDLDLEVVTEGLEQESKDHEVAEADIYPEGLGLDADESLIPADLDLTGELDSMPAAEVALSPDGRDGESLFNNAISGDETTNEAVDAVSAAGFDISSQPDELDDQEKDAAEAGLDDSLPTEVYAPELDDELTIPGGDFNLDSGIDAESEVIDTVTGLKESVDDFSVEVDEAEIDLMQLDLDDLGADISQELPDVVELRSEEEIPAEGMSTEVYTPDLSDESKMVGNDLELRTTTDDMGEVSAITEESLMSTDEALTEVYDPKMDSGEQLDLVDPDTTPSQDHLDVGLAEAQDQDIVDGLDTEVYFPETDLKTSMDGAGIETQAASTDMEVEALDQGLETVDGALTTLYDPSLDGEPEQASIETEHIPGAEFTGAQMPTETAPSDQEFDRTNDVAEMETILMEIPEDQGGSAEIASDQQFLDVDEALAGALLDQDDDEASGSQVFDVLEETSTKLDLARAYIDMGDNEGARNALEEVIQEGDGEQRKEAEEMIKRIA